jgi:tetratricopeptide (TPR) repeat protein
MGMTLNFIEMLLESGRHLHEIGRNAEALAVLTRLADFRKLPANIIEQIQALFADIYLQKEDYVKARRHLTAALAIRPLHAKYHYQMAIAIEEDDRADLNRAGMYYERAVEFDSGNAGYWADYGCYLLDAGQRQAGLKAIRKAYTLGIDEPEIVGQVAQALRQEERHDEAGVRVRAAFFRSKGDDRFRRLWQEHLFQKIRAQQQDATQVARGRKKGPVILPYTPAKITGKYRDLGGKSIRIDQPQESRGPMSPQQQETYRRPPKG